jgi:hypothetical protein
MHLDTIQINTSDHPMFPPQLLSINRQRKITPSLSITSTHTLSKSSQNSRGGTFESSSARWRSPRVHAKMDATGWPTFVALLIFTMMTSYRTCPTSPCVETTIVDYMCSPCAGSLSTTIPSGVISSLVIIPKLPKPCARISLWTSPS